MFLTSERAPGEDGIPGTGADVELLIVDEDKFSVYVTQVEDSDTRLVFNPKKMKDLRTGARCLDEVIKSQVQAIEDAERAKRQEIANGKAAMTKVGVRNRVLFV